MRFSELVEQCRQYLGAFKGYSPHTVASYETTAKQFYRYLADQGLQDDLRFFTDAHVMDFAHWLAGQGVSPNTVRSRLAGLRAIAKFGLKQRDRRGKPLLLTDPTAAFDWPQHQRPETHFFYPDELAAFITQECAFPVHVTRAVFLQTGLRVSEIIRANVGDLIESSKGYVLSVTVKGRGRREERQYTPLSAELVALLKDWLLSRNIPDLGEPLLLSVNGVRWTRTSVTDALLKLGRRAGITRLRVHPHLLRHTANVIARYGAIDPAVRARLMHHTNVNTLQRYEHLLPGELHVARAAAVQGMAAYLGERAAGIMAKLYAGSCGSRGEEPGAPGVSSGENL